MKNYKEIHIWDFPPALTYIRLNDAFRLNLLNKLLSLVGSYQKLSDLTAKLSLKYGVRKSSSPGNLYGWAKGNKKEYGKIKPINIPLWALIEYSKILSGSEGNDTKARGVLE